MFKTKRAKRQKLKAAIGLIGASGSGKTLSALMIAYGMLKEKYPEMADGDIWGKIGLVDTEHERSLVYAESTKDQLFIGDFIHLDFQPPFSASRYDAAVKQLIKDGAEVIIIDSLSHAWEGEGGFLDIQQQFGGNFQAWGKVKPHIQQFVKTLTENGVHTICTMRTKQDYQLETSETGKIQIRKLGLKPIQKDDLEYEFQINFNIDEFHTARTTKDNSGIFEGQAFKITPETGKKLFQWLEQGVDVAAERYKQRDESAANIRAIQLQLKNEKLNEYVQDLEKKANSSIEQMNPEFVEKALMLVENKAKSLGGK